MKKTIITLLFVISSVIMFSGSLDYMYGYDFSSQASTTYQGLKLSLSTDTQLGNVYFKADGELYSFNPDKMPQLNLPDKYSDILKLISEPFSFYSLTEAYAAVYFDNGTLKFGRFIPYSGSSTFYSPSVVLPAHDYVSIFEQNKTLPLDGINYNGYLGDYTYDLYFVPKLYDDIPSAVIYPVSVSQNIDAGINSTLTAQTEIKKYELTVYASSVVSNTDLYNKLRGIISLLPEEYTVDSRDIYFKSNENASFLNHNYSAYISSQILNFDVKLGYSFDHYKFYVPEKIIYSYNAEGEADVSYTYYKPYKNTVSLDYQGISFLMDSISYHGEISLSVPEKTNTDITVKNYSFDQNLNPVSVTNESSTQIFGAYCLKGVVGAEYTKGDTFTAGAELFNGMPNEEFKNKISFGGDIYIKNQISDFNFENLILVAFSGSEPGYEISSKISYSGIDGFEPSVSVNYAFSDYDSNPMKTLETLNSVKLNIKTYF
ncbi:MAG TPA: hypothetical protein PLS66_08240 [Tepiditoga sp.]|nr:hypothetical protein [Tepiditoga sp.]